MFLRRLNKLDEGIMLLLNDWGNDAVDWFFLFITNRLTWIPFYLFIIFLLFRYSKPGKAVAGVLALVAAVAAADLVSVRMFKNVFERLRPCHVEDFEGLSLVAESCGGMYGFVSSHAANSFAIAMVFFMLFNKKFSSHWIFWWAGIIAYSRVYIGVHYPSDVLVGAIVGVVVALPIRMIYKKFFP